ncbi:disulfide bond formation protein DsbA [Variovorax sp. WS11]|uniref:thiol:disulfide interchange protein DsbA/DsbL n=1 Tax=Variovorax TaxID=34072 RepID=UPI000D0D44BD|nr:MULTISPECIES: thiol:disulfide interchange protein DsbA/DsbL [Variovorax]MDR6853790.1 thiol:disulfide interchange protein DsbA [Variovorax guangxiensis]NDZ13126.1 thiol:disulfide interchange protein DsbA/DsbL [Variovorax sp. WS11]PSL83446.1 disulfide bond formation protein DsbA [Variovorax sp. WS11]
MKRRDFSLAATSLGLLPLMTPTHAQTLGPKAGTDYAVLDKRVPVDAPAGKVEVIEFFWYNCPHCNAFEPTLEAWIKKLPPHVAFKRVPVAFQASFQPQQKLYYALEAMGKVDEYQLKVFNAIHQQRQNLSGEQQIIDWVAANGLDKAKFTEQYKSFSVASKIQRAKQLQDAYQVAGVPSIGIAGRWYVDGDLAKSMERALQVTDFLIGEARKSA